MNLDLKKTVEALLISTSEPLTLKNLLSVFHKYQEAKVEEASTLEADEDVSLDLGTVKKADVEMALKSIRESAESENLAYRLVEGPKGYYLATAPQYADFVRLLRAEPKPMKLTMATLETLSIVAYRQPVTRAEIEAIRGVSVDSPINRLLELELIVVTGRAELPGRPIQYGTTDKFLEFSGIKDLEDLPASDIMNNTQIDDFMRKESEVETVVNDSTVGLPKETEPSELPLDETFVEVDWQKENIESDAYIENREGETV